jgi:hypothetical protein
VPALGAEAMACSTVTKYARSANFIAKKDGILEESAVIESSLIDEAFLTALAEHPFSSVQFFTKGS